MTWRRIHSHEIPPSTRSRRPHRKRRSSNKEKTTTMMLYCNKFAQTTMNMKSSLNLLLLLIGGVLVKQSLADTKLNDLGDTVFYEHTYGFPVTIPVQFESDFIARQNESAQQGEVYFDYTLKGNGAYLYQQYHHPTQNSHDLTIHNHQSGSTTTSEYGGEVVIDLDFEGDQKNPAVGVYTIILKINMMYMNVVGDTLMHTQSYTITVNYQGMGGETMTTINPGGHVNIFTTKGDGTTTAFISPIVLPSDLKMVSMQHNENAVSVFDDNNNDENDNIILNVATGDSNYKLWLDIKSSIKISKDRVLVSENYIYVWPFQFIDAIKEERDATNNLKIVLKSIPSDLYDLAARTKEEGKHEKDPANGNTRIWVKLIVNIKDDTTGRIGSKEFTSMVELAPPPPTSRNVEDLPMLLFIMVGCALIISSIFLFVVVSYKKKILCWKSSSQQRANKHNDQKNTSSITTTSNNSNRSNSNSNTTSSIGDVFAAIEATENDVTLTCFDDGDHIYGDHHHHHNHHDCSFDDVDKSLRRILEEI